MFFLTMFLMDGPAEKRTDKEMDAPPPAYDNSTFVNDNGQPATLELPRFPPRPPMYESSRL